MSTLAEANSVEEKTFCYRHPTVETGLRCNQCGNYICSRCAIRTPVGYRCPQCVHQQQNVYFTATQTDYVVAGVVALLLSIPICYFLSLGGLFIAVIIGIPAGGLISEAVFRATGRRRGRYTYLVVGGAVLVGAAIANFRTLGFVLSGEPGALSLLLVPAVVAVFCAGAAAARFRIGK